MNNPSDSDYYGTNRMVQESVDDEENLDEQEDIRVHHGYHECIPDRNIEYLQLPRPSHVHFNSPSSPKDRQPSILSPYLEYFIDNGGDDYYDDYDYDDDDGPGVVSKREKLERLFDGHKIRTPFDTFTFTLRFLLFILILTKYTLISTLVIQGRLFEYVNHDIVTEFKLILFTVTYFLLTMVFLIMLPVPDNKCRCHFFIVMSLTAFSIIELLFNSNHPVIKITNDLYLVSISVTILSLAYFISLWLKLILYMISKSIRAVGRNEHNETKLQQESIDNNSLNGML